MSGVDAASLESAQEALLTALSARYAGRASRLPGKCLRPRPADGRTCGRCWPAARWPRSISPSASALAGGVAALGACLFDALMALALSAVFGWALPVEGSFPAAIAFVCVVFAAGERADAEPLPRDAARAGRFAPRRRRRGARRRPPRARPRALRRRAAAAGEPVHAGAGTGAACAPWACRCWRARSAPPRTATGLTGRVWARLRARRAGK